MIFRYLIDILKEKSVYSCKCSFILAWFNAMTLREVYYELVQVYHSLQTRVAHQQNCHHFEIFKDDKF